MDGKKVIVRPYLTTRKLVPENQETPIHFLRQWIIPKEYFYRRNHFPYPDSGRDIFYLQIEGEVESSLVVSYKDIMDMPSKTVIFPMECSGNKRAYFRPETFGEQWEDGAISQAAWRGVPLRSLLERAGIKKTGIEVVFEAWDYGKKPGVPEQINYSRSLPVKKALHQDTLIAYELNGEPIPYEHGYPLRLIVPEWYAMASVKWLRKITVIDHEFRGYFQTEDYVYYPRPDSDEGKRPVTTINVSSIIQQPMNMQILNKGAHNIDGIAWTGEGIINKVEVSLDEGTTWKEAKLYHQRGEPYSWVLWNLRWEVREPGEYKIIARAYDSRGRVQPMEGEWNRKGYGYNAAYKICVKVE